MLLSICIPTRNRINSLDKALKSLTEQNYFHQSDDFEIVISDNNSTDRTDELARDYTEKYFPKIKYYKNQEDIGAEGNIEQCFKISEGDFVKIINDYCIWTPGSLESMIIFLKSCSQWKPPLFFLNGNKQSTEKVFHVDNMNDFINSISYYITWIGGFGLWRNQYESTHEFARRADLKLIQVDVMLRLFSEQKSCVINNIRYFETIEVGPKGGYSISEIFCKNFLSIVNEHQHQISPEIWSKLKYETLIELIIPWHFNKNHNFIKELLHPHLSIYFNEPYYKDEITRAVDEYSNLYNITESQILVDLWRVKNFHNETFLTKMCSIHKISVGNYSYGPIEAWEWGNSDEYLQIGNFVSIAAGVKFLLGGNHPYTGFSTYPFKVKFLNYKSEATSKGFIDVGDDVWIGQDALILSGVSIGQGAIVSAGAVVTKDIPAYAIVGGNPARVIKYRFPPNIINNLIKLDFEKLTPETIIKLGEKLYDAVDESNIHRIISELNMN